MKSARNPGLPAIRSIPANISRPVPGRCPRVRVPGEEFTRYTPRYQFSNYIYLVRNDAAGRAFTQAHLDNMTSLLRRCEPDLADQRSQRLALAALAHGTHGAGRRTKS